jgi:hypothetical protein
VVCPDGVSRRCVFRVAFFIADTPEKAKLMLTHGHQCNICTAGKECDVQWCDLGDGGFAKAPLRCIKEAQGLWSEAADAFDTANDNGAPVTRTLEAAKQIMKQKSLKFSKTEPILYNLPGFGFESLAFEEMHTLEGLSKWVITFTIAAVKKCHPQYSSTLAKIDFLAQQTAAGMSPLLRPLRYGFTSMTFGTYQEWKTVIVLLLPLVSMLLEGDWWEETPASYLIFECSKFIFCCTNSILSHQIPCLGSQTPFWSPRTRF